MSRPQVVDLRLNAEDLGKVRVRAGGGPFTETVFSLRLLRARQPSPLGAAWVERVRRQVDSPSIPLSVLTLVELVTDLHTIVTQAPSVHVALRRLKEELVEPLPAVTSALLARADTAAGSLRSWLDDLLGGSERAVDELVASFLEYYRRAVDPYWRSIRSHLAAERSRCGQVMAEGGVNRLLATFHPKVHWRTPVLQVGDVGTPPPRPRGRTRGDATERRGSHLLDGRSLVLVPSTFCLGAPQILWSRHDTTQPAALVYPALRDMEEAASLWAPTRAPSPRALARLLGRTQAAALAVIAETCTTTELAHRARVSLSTASHHASILRAAGLVISRRSGNTVVHRLSAVGADLLRAGQGARTGQGTEE